MYEVENVIAGKQKAFHFTLFKHIRKLNKMSCRLQTHDP